MLEGRHADHSISAKQTQSFLFFFPFEMLFIDILSPPSCLLSLQDKKGFLHLRVYPPHNFLSSLWTFLHEPGLQHGVPSDRRRQHAGYVCRMERSVSVGGYLRSLIMAYLTSKSPPSPQPQIRHFSCFAAGGFYCWVFLCVLWFPGAEQRPASNTWCGRHSPLKICRFSPHKCLGEPLRGDSLWPLGAFVGTCTPFDPVPALIGL